MIMNSKCASCQTSATSTVSPRATVTRAGSVWVAAHLEPGLVSEGSAVGGCVVGGCVVGGCVVGGCVVGGCVVGGCAVWGCVVGGCVPVT